jgi:hypothetical protein
MQCIISLEKFWWGKMLSFTVPQLSVSCPPSTDHQRLSRIIDLTYARRKLEGYGLFAMEVVTA